MTRPPFEALDRSPLVLASGSPRRAELLGLLQIPFSVSSPSFEEEPGSDLPPVEEAARNARGKAESVSISNPGRLVLGADTLVLIGDRALGKPSDAAEAREMLELLSGKDHEVVTGLHLISPDRRSMTQVVTSKVTFRSLSGAEIDWYIGTGEPFDKAGAYGIQGSAAPFVERIDGCYFNVVGLPLSALFAMVESALGAPTSTKGAP